MLDALFWLDIFVSARTSFRHEDNEIEMNPKVIFLRYAKPWLVLDVLGVFPFEVFVGGVCCWDVAGNLTTFNGLRMFRIVRLFATTRKPDKRTHEVSTNIMAANLARIGRLLVVFFLLAHWIACLWWALGSSEANMALEEAGGGVAWINRPGRAGYTLSIDSPLTQARRAAPPSPSFPAHPTHPSPPLRSRTSRRCTGRCRR